MRKKDKLKNAHAFFLTLFNRTPGASALTQVWEVIKKVFMWIGALGAAIFTVLFVRDCRIKSGNDKEDMATDIREDDIDEINAKAAKKREEAIARIERADARTLSEGYGSVCDAISDGKSRFRKRCGRADD